MYRFDVVPSWYLVIVVYSKAPSYTAWGWWLAWRAFHPVPYPELLPVSRYLEVKDGCILCSDSMVGLA